MITSLRPLLIGARRARLVLVLGSLAIVLFLTSGAFGPIRAGAFTHDIHGVYCRVKPQLCRTVTKQVTRTSSIPGTTVTNRQTVQQTTVTTSTQTLVIALVSTTTSVVVTATDSTQTFTVTSTTATTTVTETSTTVQTISVGD